nr:zinc-binding dehydrogenase [Compostimonas suwonensis]
MYFEEFGQAPVIREVPDPVASPGGVVVRVQTTGLCRSDVHGWLGHDDGIALPHVPGHELVGVIEQIGANVTGFAPGQRVTTPFVCACGRCPECLGGNAQVCRNQTQPGFTHWGSYAELVALHDAELNLIPVPDEMDAGAAALLGCRFATAFRGLVHQSALQPDEWLLVVGCGGVGLSAVMIGRAIGARVIAVDISDGALATAARLGAEHTINTDGVEQGEILSTIRAITGEAGVDVSVEALGREATVALAILSLAPRGRHVQIGLLANDPVVPMSAIIAGELTIRGSHGMPASDYPELLALVASGALRPQELIDQHIGLDEVPEAMLRMSRGELTGVTVIDVAA